MATTSVLASPLAASTTRRPIPAGPAAQSKNQVSPAFTRRQLALRLGAAGGCVFLFPVFPQKAEGFTGEALKDTQRQAERSFQETKSAADRAGDQAGSVIDDISNRVQDTLQQVKGNASETVDNIGTQGGSARDGLADAAQRAADNIKGKVSSDVDNAKDSAGSVREGVKGFTAEGAKPV